MTVDRFENSQKSNQAGIIMSEEFQKFQQKFSYTFGALKAMWWRLKRIVRGSNTCTCKEIMKREKIEKKWGF